MRLGLVVVLISFLAWFVYPQDSSEWYQGKPINRIEFEGLKHVKISELEGVTEPFIGRLFNDDVFWEIQGRIYALEFFDLISPRAVPLDPSGSEVIIRFTVTERPIVSRITYVGNSKLRRSELADVVTLKENDVVNQLKLRTDELALTNKYLEKGFPDVRVRSETKTNPDSTITVTFYITEGERITISEFRFEGNTTFSTRTLRGQLSLKTKGLLSDGAFQEAKLVADRGALTQYYHDRGYIDAEVIDVSQDVLKDEKGNNNMIITFRIYEGRIYNFGGVSFEGNAIFTSEHLGQQVRSREGDTVNERRVEADLQRVADVYLENGYIFNTINREEIRDTEAGIISYKISIVERGRAHIENILVRGNEKTKDHVILREIPLEPGDIFSKAKVMDGLRNLYNLQYFSNVIPDTPPGSTDNLMDLIIDVEEQPTTNIQFGVSFSGSSDPDAFPISLLFELNDRNFLGYGNMVGAKVNASVDTQTVALEYTQRWIFGLPLSGGFDFTVNRTSRYAAMDNTAPFFNGDELYAYPDGFNSYDDYVAASKLPPDQYLMKYNQLSLSLGFSTGYRFTTPVGNLGLGGGIRAGIVRNSYDSSLYRPFDPALREGNNTFTPAFSVWNSVSLDQRDIYYDPSKGYYGIQRIGFYGIFPFEREHYIKTDTKAEWFTTLFSLPITDTYNLKAVFGIHSGLSFIVPEPGYDSVRIESANMLSVDGMFVGRGWSDRRSDRGLALWENWAEVRFPVVPGMLAVDFFFDAAAKKDTPGDFFRNFEAEDMLYSFGGGIRFSIPQFPLRFLIAKRFKVEDGTPQWQSGPIFRIPGNPRSGLDFVISFAMATY
ncbi:MAG: outer membrane protein assembly factor BamA [Spirochaetaceae bacterium]|jgi:outer membrane protein insertion porin family|nr:outer membrane protein assembly factor BamA [Spirochaetaceae bacterium]